MATLALPGWLQAQNPKRSKAPAATVSDLERDKPYLRIAKVLYADDFKSGLANWVIEAEKPGRISSQDGILEIDVPAGATLWFKHELNGPVLIQYEATVVSAGGPNDRVSDLNCFWMATNAQAPKSVLARPRSGAFAQYNDLLTYYVGLGGNSNTTTRFRRYIGSRTERPLLPGNDRSAREDLIQPNRKQTIRLVANGNYIAYYRDQQRLFFMNDNEPYTHGWFALRTVTNHMRIGKLRIYQLKPGPR